MNLSNPKIHLIFVTLLAILGLTACQGNVPQAAEEIGPATAAVVESRPIPDGPVLLRENIGLRKIVEVDGGAIKLALHPTTGELYYLRSEAGLFKVNLGDAPTTEKVVDITEITPSGSLAGMKFGPDGLLYVVVNRRPNESEIFTQAAVYKGLLDNPGASVWLNVATTEPYEVSNTNFDHLFNGIVISPDNSTIFLNSGSRTDHGEVQDTDGNFPGLRETAMTSRIFQVPVDAVDLVIPNDEAAQQAAGLLYATGTRNAYDLEFGPNGDLFGVDNGPDADYPEELNWLREGHHYGFPWRFGEDENPQQRADYDPAQDRRLSEDFIAVKAETYQNDPGFPPPPARFTAPIYNFGPDGDIYRNEDGVPQDASSKREHLATFTPHRSPLGLVFIDDDQLPDYLQPPADRLSVLVLSWGAAGGDLTDQGQDLLHMVLTKNGENYEAVTRQIAREFRRPIDAVLLDNRLYILEWDGAGVIWELTFN